MTALPFRIGHGYDAHRFAVDRPLILGGVRVREDNGLEGHSDADVLTHAVIDAVLGAMALGDLGTHFPPTEAKWKDADSMDLLAHARELAAAQGGKAAQVDVILYLEQPRVAHHLDTMRDNLARVLALSHTHISIKATTTEGMGFVGRGEGASATAVVLMATG